MQKPLVLHDRVVVQNHVVEVVALLLPVRRKVGAAAFVGLADAAGAVDEDFAEAAVVRLVGVLIAQMPLAEDAGLRSRPCGAAAETWWSTAPSVPVP